MDFKAIKIIVDLMKQSELTEFQIEEKDLKLCIKRQADGTVLTAPIPAAPVTVAALTTTAAASSTPVADVNDKTVALIKSPMVGTFYTASSPDSPAFVSVGAKVTIETTVCIIEAMKVMNEIQAEVSGTILEVLVNNGQAVEYGQAMFKVKLSQS